MKKLFITFMCLSMTYSFADRKTHKEFEEKNQKLGALLDEIFISPEPYDYTTELNDQLNMSKKEIDQKKIEIELFYSNLFLHYEDLKSKYNQLEQEVIKSRKLSEEERKVALNSIKYDRDIMLDSRLSEYKKKYSLIKDSLAIETKTYDLYDLFNKTKTFENRNNCQIAKIEFNKSSETLKLIVKQKQKEIEYKIENKDIAHHSVAVSNLIFHDQLREKALMLKEPSNIKQLLTANKRLIHKFYAKDAQGGLSKIVLYENKNGVIDNAYFEMDKLETVS